MTPQIKCLMDFWLGQILLENLTNNPFRAPNKERHKLKASCYQLMLAFLGDLLLMLEERFNDAGSLLHEVGRLNWHRDLDLRHEVVQLRTWKQGVIDRPAVFLSKLFAVVQSTPNGEPSSARCLYWSRMKVPDESYLALLGKKKLRKNQNNLAFHPGPVQPPSGECSPLRSSRCKQNTRYHHLIQVKAGSFQQALRSQTQYISDQCFHLHADGAPFNVVDWHREKNSCQKRRSDGNLG